MTTPTAAPPLVTALARRYRLDLDTSTTATPAWSQVIGLTSFAPKTPATMQDDDDYDSAGWGSQVKTMLAWSLDCTIKIGTVSGVEPATHIALRDAATKFGSGGVVHVRWYDRNGGTAAYEGYAEVSWDESGGGPKDLAAADVSFTGKGARVKIANPAVV